MSPLPAAAVDQPVAQVEPFETPEPVATDPEDDVGPLPSAAQVQPPALTYDHESTRGGAVTRRQVRFLLVLTLVNTLMLGLFVAGPGLSKITGGWWNSYKQWRDERAKAKQAKAARDTFLANYQNLLAHAAPSDKIAYEEDHDRAAKHLAGGGYVAYYTGSNPIYLTPKPWQSPVMSQAAPPLLSVTVRPGVSGAPLFVGGRKTPSGQERLVWVGLIVDQRWETLSTPFPAESTTTRNYNVKTRRILTARTYNAHASDNIAEGGGQYSLEILQPRDRETSVAWSKTTSWENGNVEITSRNVMRFFNGQPDKSDPSRFTITYELNGQRGIIDGQIHDDQSVFLQPRQGRIVNADQLGRARQWDPHAEPAPK